MPWMPFLDGEQILLFLFLPFLRGGTFFFFTVEGLIKVVAACSATQGWRKACWKEMSQLVLRCPSVFAVPRKGGKFM